MDPVIALYIAGGLLVWLVGYGSGTVFRHTRQILEKASRGS